ncbi:MAG: aldose epimerase [Cyanobacteria bacterium P01_A01_bin.45]
MFSISLQQQQYKTHILTDETTRSRLEVVPERGGIITKWSIDGKDILYLDEERFTNPDLSVRGGFPILFPICGNLPNDTYTYDGKEYTLKQHGFARNSSWEAHSVVSDEGVKIELTLNSNEETKKVYPFDFRLCFTYKIYGNTLEIQQLYSNLSNSQTLVFSSGFHPYFLTVDKNQLQFEIPSGQYQDQSTKEIHNFDGNFDFDRSEIDVGFQNLSANCATVTDNSRKLKLQLDFDDTFSTLVFWTLKGKNFYCLEPWTANRNAINTKENLISLEPEADYSTTVRLRADFF